ncbi:nicotinate-nucleotide adenylyltransferase [Sedimentibacter acidaminivorans]|jgi:nicotinate-nucleotide adenylyltransferase|uniref:Probable nicotinate-nucleotide adenylyltransferase n=1 Tax=Sedimentibacter acidaminivorans TaxID=913099 RepID=A0ABS4GBA5_9FIRM|nr:nicotinate-nucleotide adenylyltransferase [Sedimentibacter acidaminivorans]MBP1924973.1 nicotinate-nucleotide adenylyltransferase [Sedimentibacter acidaminivorans]
MKRRIGVMGGTFDPIHYGHLIIANEVLDKYNMEKIIFVPAGKPPHKKVTGACALDRFLMTNIATLSNNKFIVSDIEIKSLEKSYTINTIRKLINEYDNTEFYFITGTDAIVELPNWHETENLLKMCKFIGVSRSGYSTLDIEFKINEIMNRYNGQIELLQVPMLEISSTDIRERINLGRSIKYLLPEIVEKFIIKNNLYLE